MPYADFDAREYEFDGLRRTVFESGEGPAVIVIHEAPGLHPGVAAFARRVRARGFRVYMPSLIGEPGRPASLGYSLGTLARACVVREFTVFATGKASPITTWLRSLARHAHEVCGGPGVGAVGMCLSGGFALAMMSDARMIAPVLSQPSLPFGITAAQKRDLGVDAQTLATIRERAADGVCVLGLRFTEDFMVPPERFARLREVLGDNFIAVEIDSSPGNPHGIPRTAHSVLALDFVEDPEHPTWAAMEKVLDFYDERLKV
ncbi:dienelactone hydrolase family protein [Pseudenhygromyxa sp. WMMC2535]|uniref:dienelactone hydrolase family protein n=1 Tax=Pseudenhygromyxa sp. WMMC2535 TaxID=2712867 RepID=UPI001554FE75|nr:dienelactone hydrolase family protein [Pseudenhygromyxa sp. WMMC2535]NVB41113.1 dienelactone hydrolase family protein [Pseudenhygromyxa sp. WMMC2535]